MSRIQLRRASQSEEAQFGALLDTDLDEVYSSFGMRLGTLGPDESPTDAARRWLDSRRKQLHTIICVEGNYCAFIEANGAVRQIDLLVCLADMLAAAFGALPVYTLSALLIRNGLGEFCGCKD